MKNASQPTSKPTSPYPGLRPYQEDEQDNFFGRDADCEILVDKLLGNRLTLLFAATGVGKSSLLQAAVMPQLKQPLGENLCVIYHNDWVLEPIDHLKASIIKGITTQDIPFKPQQTLPELLEFCTLFTRHPLVIILDQFEEFFRYQKQGAQFQAFIDQITHLVINTQIPLSLVISMREDFALELDAFKPKLPTLLFENYYRIDKLDEQAARDAISIPAQRLGFYYEAPLFETLLSDLLSRDLDRAPNRLSEDISKTVEPPYIQIVCRQLWELEQYNPDKILRLSTYQNKGGAKGLLSNYVKTELSQFSRDEKGLASAAFDHLVSRRGTKMPYTVEDLAPIINQKEAALGKVFKKLSDKRILRSQQRASTIWYELYHDMFSQVIEAWNLIWKAKIRRRRFIKGLTTTVAVILALYIGFDYWQNKYHQQLRSKNTPSAYLEIYQGKLNSTDLFQQQDFITETRYQRQHIEPDKCVKACTVMEAKNLNSELIQTLPLLERISAYAEDGQFAKAMALFDSTLKLNDTNNSKIALKKLANIYINIALPKMIWHLKNSKSQTIRYTVETNIARVASKALLQKDSADNWLILNKNISRYSLNHHYINWIVRKQKLKEIIIAGLFTNQFELYSDATLFKLLMSQIGISAIPLLLDALGDENGPVRSAAAKALGPLQHPQTLKPLITALGDENGSVRSAAAKALGPLQHPQTLKPLITALGDENDDVRSAAAEALGPLQHPQALKALITALGDENSDVRSAAAKALGQFQHPQALKALLTALGDENKFVRRSATRALGQLNSLQAVEALIPFIFDRKSEYSSINSGKASREALLNIAKNHSCPILQQWIEDLEIFYPIESEADDSKKTPEPSPQQLQQQIETSDSKIVLSDKIKALNQFMKIKPHLAQQTLLKLLQNQANEASFGTRLYTYLADLNATQALETLQQRLDTIEQQWQKWRKERDNLSDDATDQQRETLAKNKPNPLISPYIYADAIARLDPDQGIALLEHSLAEARQGAWNGLAQLGDMELVQKLDKIRAANQDNPILHHAAFRAIDLSLVTIETRSKKQDRDALNRYLAHLTQQGRIHSSADLSKNDPVALRMEWTRDRLNETFDSLERVHCRIEHWFDEEFFACPSTS